MTNALVTLPRIERLPAAAPVVSFVGTSSVDCAALYGYCTPNALMPWQMRTLGYGVGRVDNRWAASNVTIVKPRQQGGTETALVRMLLGMLEFGERQVYTAANADTARSTFDRLLQMFEGSTELHRHIDTVGRRRAQGRQSLRLRNGAAAFFMTRGSTGHRGLTADLVVHDDAEWLPDEVYASAAMCNAARPDPQTWFVATPPRRSRARGNNPITHAAAYRNARVLARLRRNALWGVDPHQYFAEYSADDARDERGKLLVDTSSDSVVAAANPALGYLFDLSQIETERLSMPAEIFESERLGIGAWPALDDEVPS